MPKPLHIAQLLQQEKNKTPQTDALLEEAKRVLLKSQLNEKNVLNNLKFYNSSFELLDDDETDTQQVYTTQQIKTICSQYRLRFLPSQHYTGEIPYEAILKIKDLNKNYRKDLQHFKILSSEKFFTKEKSDQALLFAQTLHGNYYLIHSWGNAYKANRTLRCFPARSFETLFFCFILLSLVEAMLLPNHLISSDTRATYFSMYRAAALFHLLILNVGLGALFLMAAHFTFSENNWDTVPRKQIK